MSLSAPSLTASLVASLLAFASVLVPASALGQTPASPSAANDAAVDSAAVAAVSTVETTSGTGYFSGVHDASTGDGTMPLRASAIYNGQVGYTAFALWVMEEIEPSAARPVQVTAGEQTWTVRERNVSVRDTAVVVVLDRSEFARVAGAGTARLEVGSRSAPLPAALQRQMRAIEAVCTRKPIGCKRQ